MFKLPKISLKALISPLKVLFNRSLGLFLVEATGVVAVLLGVAHYCWPAAVIAAGVVLVAAVERNS